MDLELRGKRAIVTGGSRGIGKAIARALATEGCNVAICARTRETLDATARELGKETGSKVVPFVADTGSGDSVRSMVDAVVGTLGGVDILVNNAARPGGQGPVPNLAQITDDAFNEDVNVKVLGYLRCAQAVAPYMAKQRWGRIISISGLAARNAGSTIGSMRNVAIVAMAKNLAAELGPLGINVTVVHPGTTRTEATPGVIRRHAQAENVAPEEIECRMSQSNLVRRIIDASDVANIVAFLASPKSVAINGDVIAAGGGVGTAIYY